MEIEKRISGIKDYFIGMKVEEAEDDKNEKVKVIYVSASFPNTWIIDEATKEMFNIDYLKDGNEYYFWTDLDTGFDKIFQAIEYNIKNNKIAEEKAKIFLEKKKELESIFRDDSITVESLRNLRFVYDSESKKTSIAPPVQKKEEKSKEVKKK